MILSISCSEKGNKVHTNIYKRDFTKSWEMSDKWNIAHSSNVALGDSSQESELKQLENISVTENTISVDTVEANVLAGEDKSEPLPASSRMSFRKRKLSNARHFSDSLSDDGNGTSVSNNEDKCEFVGPIRSARRLSLEQVRPSNSEAVGCTRYSTRRNALCDPFRMLMSQSKREQLEQKVEKRKTSVTRKVSNFLTISLDLNREEELI